MTLCVRERYSLESMIGANSHAMHGVLQLIDIDTYTWGSTHCYFNKRCKNDLASDIGLHILNSDK